MLGHGPLRSSQRWTATSEKRRQLLLVSAAETGDTFDEDTEMTNAFSYHHSFVAVAAGVVPVADGGVAAPLVAPVPFRL